jgi:iron(III) transport system permease protein
LADIAVKTQDGPLKRIVARRPGLAVVVFTVLLGVVAFVVLYPLVILFLKSFETNQFGVKPVTTGLDNWRLVLSEPRMLEAIKNTITLALTRQVIALVVGITLAWVIARTNVPGRNWLEFGFWIALFLPTLTVTLGWIIMFDSFRGLVNVALVNWVWFIDEPPFEVFSWWGIVFVHLMTGTLAIKVMLLTPAFRNMDASLEEASRTLGAGTFTTLWRVVVPIMMPAIVVVTMLGTIRSLEAFEVELVLGVLDEIDVYSTIIYKEVHTEPPQYGNATAMAMMFLAILVPFIVLQQWISGRRNHATISGKYASRVQDLGRWKWPTFAAIATLLLFLTVIPVALVVLSTFMKLFGFFFIDDPWTLQNWRDSATDAGVLRALKNSLILGIGSSVLAMTAFTFIAYVTVRTKFWGRRYLDFLTWLPTTIPGIVLSLGFLWLFLQVALFRDYLYGTMWALIIAVALGGITLGVQIVKSSMVQLGAELEEASWASGAGAFYTFRRIVLPLIMPAVVVVGVLTFATAVRATSIVALLATGKSKPLSMLQLDHMADGDFGEAAVIGVFLVVLITGVAVIARIFGLKVGLGGGR